jgi:hypothetical protein
MGGGHPLRVSSKLYPRVRCLLNNPCSPLFFVGTIYNTVHSNIDSRESSYQFLLQSLVGVIYSCILMIICNINFSVEYLCYGVIQNSIFVPSRELQCGKQAESGVFYILCIHDIYTQTLYASLYCTIKGEKKWKVLWRMEWKSS